MTFHTDLPTAHAATAPAQGGERTAEKVSEVSGEIGNARAAREAIERIEREAALDDLLSRWHHWQIRSRATVSTGFASSAPGSESYRTSRQYDTGEMLDDAVNSRECGAVEHAVTEIGRADPQMALALRVHARALYIGSTAISNPRLPADKVALDALIAVARKTLTRRLMIEGVLA